MDNILSAILDLFLARGPFAIRGLIRTVIVNAFQGQSLRALSHVGKEGSEIVTPTSTDFNSPAAIIFPSRMIFVSATLDHVMPCGIFWSRWLRATMRLAASTQKFFLKAATGFRVASAKMTPIYDKFISAITFTAPSFAFDIGQGNQSAKSLSLQVQWWSSSGFFHWYSISRFAVKGN